MNNYQKLQEILDIHPSSAPESPYFTEILKTLFTEEEASIAVNMNFTPVSAKEIAEKAGIDQKKAAQYLEEMANKVVIFSKEKDGEKKYGLVPTIPGLFEFPFMKGGGTPMHEKLADLWEKYHRDSLSKSFTSSKTPQMRIVPVEKSLKAQSIAHPYEEVAKLIENSDFISLAKCACRVSLKRCDAPKEVCLIFDAPGKFLVEKEYARKISRQEAMEVLDRSEKAGLVHTSNNSKDRASVICNCCPCCCTILRGATEHQFPNAFATSRWIPAWNADLCTACGNCADNRCPMNAINLIGNFVDIEEQFCIGCGLCVSGCPEGALKLVERDNQPETPETIKDMAFKILTEKGNLEKFTELNKK